MNVSEKQKHDRLVVAWGREGLGVWDYQMQTYTGWVNKRCCCASRGTIQDL